jgi:5-methylcytosine-specific restriction endonuclease McrA
MNEKKKIRKIFRDSVLLRDNNKCVMCENTEDLDAHHITDRTEMPNGGYVLENGITLCPNHHRNAEWWHKSDGEHFIIGFTPYDLYERINSSYQLAFKKSMGL